MTKIKEDTEQKALVNWLKLNGYFYFAPMNENIFSFLDRSIAVKLQQKANSMGAIKGVPDMVIFLDNTILFLELKVRPKTLKNGTKSYSNSKVSDEQKAFINSANEYHYAVGKIAYGYEDAIGIITDLH